MTDQIDIREAHDRKYSRFRGCDELCDQLSDRQALEPTELDDDEMYQRHHHQNELHEL